MTEEKRVNSKPESDDVVGACAGAAESHKEKSSKVESGKNAKPEVGKFAASVGKTQSRISADLAEVEKLRAEAELLRNQLRLAVADSKNLERLMNREISDAKVFSISGFVRDLIPSFDNLEASLKNLSADDSVHAGIEMTWNSLMAVLNSHGVTRVCPVGEAFDTKFHTAVTQVIDNDKPAGTIIEVVQAGYVLNGKVLRPASVVVSAQANN
ncbi:nucleotide exchange factor GrpE [Anaplasma phagocytophilum]|uniref:nucleotide exchange factor GrpE n=1 Tax=Anaplasma phagocytophilum TaxID=948 RepID=UPI00200F6739|nr:nucleotide exchange factor GrpE [Anaplasma phagocytophilum]UQD54219.1 nucleotide exchange factor GrpE [Anaplasma phagocytophilum]